MMPFRIVQSQQNPRLKQLRRALAQPGRKAGEPAGVEGPILLAEALQARLNIPAVFVAEGSEHLVAGLSFAPQTELLLLPRDLLSSALSTETPQPVAALVEPPGWSWNDLLTPPRHGAPLLIALAGIQDPGNLGTILRSAEAFGATGIVSLPGTVSQWNPKAVRASAGSVFRVSFLSAGPDDFFERMRQARVHVLTTAAPDRTQTPAASAPEQADLRAPIAILIGNEGNGVPRELAARAAAAVAIPCPGPVESLNAAVAASVLLYEASRQRSAGESAAPQRRKGAR